MATTQCRLLLPIWVLIFKIAPFDMNCSHSMCAKRLRTARHPNPARWASVMITISTDQYPYIQRSPSRARTLRQRTHPDQRFAAGLAPLRSAEMHAHTI